MKSVVFKVFRLLFLCVGLFLLWGVVQKIGWYAILHEIVKLNFWFLPILLIGFLWYLAYTEAWQNILKIQGNDIPFWPLFRAKISCDTVTTMTPANFLGGDTMRIYQLRKAVLNVTSVAATVVVDRTINSIAIVVVIFFGAIIAFLTIPGLPIQVSIGIPLFLLTTSSMILFFMIRQHRGLFRSVLNLAQKLHIAKKWVQKYQGKAQELDEQVSSLYKKSQKVFWIALFFHVLGRLLGVLEVYCIGKTIEADFTITVALLLATLSPIINMAFTFIPGALGIMEGAYSAILYLLGMDPAIGLTIQIVKRIRAGLWLGLGLLFIAFFRHHQRADYNKGPLQQPL